MIVCESCKEELTVDQSGNDRAFPAYTVAGGLIGAAGVLVTGAFLLVPIAVVTGALTDVLSRHCGVCGNEIEEGESAYHAMEELDDGIGGRSYRHAGNPQGPMSPGLQKRGVPSRPEGLQTTNETPGRLGTAGEKFPGASHDPPPQDRLVFDQLEGKLVQPEPLADEGAVNLNSPDSFDPHACIGFGEQGAFALEQSPWDPDMDESCCFHDDIMADIDPLGPADEAQIEGV